MKGGGSMRKIVLLSAMLVLLYGVAGCGIKQIAEPDSAEVSTEESLDDPQSGHEGSRQSEDVRTSDTQEGVAATETPAYRTGKKGDDFILPDAQTHVYTLEELSGLTKEELRISRNEIYARHGRKFKSAELNSYFAEKAWYQPAVEADAFDDGVLNQAEIENLKLIKEAEERASSEFISCPKIGLEEFPHIDGSTATIPLSQAIYRLATGASQKEAEAAVEHSKTTWAYENLQSISGKGLVIAYEPGEELKERLKKDDSLIIKPIGRDALVFMINESNPVTSLSQKQVVDIYSGKAGNWKTFGGKNQSIKAFQRPEASGSQNLMEKLVMKGTPMADAPLEFYASEMGELIEKVSSYDNTGEALGYSVYYYARNMYQKPGLKFVAVDGVMPSNDTIRNGTYPYVNDFYAAIRKDEPKDSKASQLFEWLTSEDGQALINSLGYVGINDSKKAVPAVLAEERETEYTAEIPIAAGNTFFADGEYLYGEKGIALFDKKMNLVKFIPHIAPYQMPYFWEGSADTPLLMRDTISGKYGVYSIAKERWICDPVYDNGFLAREGVVLLQKEEKAEESEESYQWSYLYNYVDKSGTIVRKDMTQEEWEEWNPEEEYHYIDRTEFAQTYPELLNRCGAGAEDVQIYSAEYQEDIAVIKKGDKETYYKMDGTFLFEFDRRQFALGAEEAWSYPFIINEEMAYLRVAVSGEDITGYFIYRDGNLVKELETDTGEWIRDIGEHYYVMSRGSYLYVYNYDDKPCARFLQGYYMND